MKRIALLRKEKQISQIALSLKLNVSQKTISAYENGKSEPSIAVLKKLAEIFNTSVDYLIEYTDIKTPIDKIAQNQIYEDECELLNIYRELSSKDRYIATGILIGINEKRKSESNI